jgi:hypothetical protein
MLAIEIVRGGRSIGTREREREGNNEIKDYKRFIKRRERKKKGKLFQAVRKGNYQNMSGV